MIEVVEHGADGRLKEVISDFRYWHRDKDTDSRSGYDYSRRMLRVAEERLEHIAMSVNRGDDGEPYVRLLVGEQALQSFWFSGRPYGMMSIDAGDELQPGSSLRLRHFRQRLNNSLYHSLPLMYAGNVEMVHSELIAQTLNEGGSLDIVVGEDD